MKKYYFKNKGREYWRCFLPFTKGKVPEGRKGLIKPFPTLPFVKGGSLIPNY